MALYFTIGLLYSLFLLYKSYSSIRRRNREHWAGILLVGTLFWPVDVIVSREQLVAKN